MATIALTVYNDYLVDFLFVLLQSFKDNYEEQPKIMLYYCNVSPKYIDDIKSKCDISLKEVPEFEELAKEKSTHQRLPRKIEIWYKQLLECEDDEIIFMDIDMLVLKPFEHHFKDIDFGYSFKEPGKPYRREINAGVMYVKKSEKTIVFFKKMLDYVLKACASDKIKEIDLMWGGTEQAFLGEYFGNIKHGGGLFKDGIKFKGFHIDLFNAARTKKIKPETCVLHYPGGWRFLFTKMEEGFCKSRKDKYLNSYKQMRKLWEKTLKRWQNRTQKEKK